MGGRLERPSFRKGRPRNAEDMGAISFGQRVHAPGGHTWRRKQSRRNRFRRPEIRSPESLNSGVFAPAHRACARACPGHRGVSNPVAGPHRVSRDACVLRCVTSERPYIITRTDSCQVPGRDFLLPPGPQAECAAASPAPPSRALAAPKCSLSSGGRGSGKTCPPRSGSRDTANRGTCPPNPRSRAPRPGGRSAGPETAIRAETGGSVSAGREMGRCGRSERRAGGGRASPGTRPRQPAPGRAGTASEWRRGRRPAGA